MEPNSLAVSLRTLRSSAIISRRLPSSALHIAEAVGWEFVLIYPSIEGR